MLENGTTTSTALATSRPEAISSAALDRQFQMALEPSNFMDAYKAAAMLASVGICGVKSAEDALTRILAGRGVGLTMIASLRFVHVIKGRPGLDASVMHGLCLRRGDCEKFDCVEDSPTSVTYIVKRKGRPEIKVQWTLQDAKVAKLLNEGDTDSNWVKYPRQMLHARCKGDGAKRGWPDAMAGLSSVEELRDGAIDTEGESIEEVRTMVAEVAQSPLPKQPVAVPTSPVVHAPPPVIADGAFDPDNTDGELPHTPASATAPVEQPKPVAPPPPPPVKEPAPAVPPAKPVVPEPAPTPPKNEAPPKTDVVAGPAIPAPRQAAVRDYDAELAGLRAALQHVVAGDENAMLEIRGQIKAWDAPEPWKRQAKDAYNAERARVLKVVQK